MKCRYHTWLRTWDAASAESHGFLYRCTKCKAERIFLKHEPKSLELPGLKEFANMMGYRLSALFKGKTK